MSKDKKPARPRAETPKGFRDYFGAEVTQRQEMLAKIAEVYHRHGFEALESSAVETVESLGKFLPDVDRPNEGVFAWQEDEDATWLALRYDLTAPLARVYAQHKNEVATPYRRYAMGPVWRNEKPGPGRFRQFYQCDADTVGTASPAADAEMCMMLAECLEAVGIERGDYVVRVNNRKVLNGVMEVAGILDPSDPDRFADERGVVLRAIDKLDRLGPEGVRALLGEGRRDGSGDFTKGAGLGTEAAEAVMRYVTARTEIDREIRRLHAKPLRDPDANDPDLSGIPGISGTAHPAAEGSGSLNSSATASDALRNAASLHVIRDIVSSSTLGLEGADELETIARLLETQGYGSDRVQIDPSVVRGLGYYTGPVFEAELTFEILDEKNRPRQFGSVAGGGRYDDLVKRFTGQAVPATGVSIGVDRLLAALHAKGRMSDSAQGPVIVTVMDRDRMADYFAIAAELRQAGIRAEVYLGNPKSFGNQLKYADARRAPLAIIEGADEKARGVVQVKDLVLGAKIAAQASVAEWKSQPAQSEVPREGLVHSIKRMLG